MLTILLTLIIVGVLLALMNQFLPMAPPIRMLVNAVIVIAAILYVLEALGVMRVGHLPRVA